MGESYSSCAKKSGITMVQNDKGEDVSTRSLRCLRGLWASFYCFLDGYSGYFQIEIDVEDQEKTTFTCPFGTYAYRRMPFDLCNAPATFQRCMLSIFSDMVERIMEVFMDDITIYGIQQGIVLGHIISKQGIEVDKAKDAKFIWDDRCQRSFEELKLFLTTAPIVRAPNWQLPFEVMCDASDFAIGVVLGQREDGKPYVIYYASKTLNEAKETTQPPRKNYAKARLIRWILLLQEFNLHIKDKKGVENVESLMLVEVAPWYAHIANYLVTGEVPSGEHEQKDWSVKLLDSLWAYRTTYKTIRDVSLSPSLCKHVIPVELEYKAWWAIKKLNMDLSRAGLKRFLDLNELEELRNDATSIQKLQKRD
ncbi:Retrovirus-related Pol polyprotein from transposon 17.6 [Vitis vinifera]|uniref:Retrovirus-related Pol polyprotein from transposon 17.6 n=1 Tax=Vitis vinifera TaxID=29760 RepID=A0A438CFM6_VITVI|nr:Retrovirus-related Pol polyprotein from transposon 17.6 [Vitis vinifera]